jgi:hypothetical protein
LKGVPPPWNPRSIREERKDMARKLRRNASAAGESIQPSKKPHAGSAVGELCIVSSEFDSYPGG